MRKTIDTRKAFADPAAKTLLKELGPEKLKVVADFFRMETAGHKMKPDELIDSIVALLDRMDVPSSEEVH